MHPEYRYRATVASVYDGDTFRADVDLGFSAWLKNIQFRMFGINTPELRGGTEAEKRAGYAARDRLRELMPVGEAVLIRSTKAGKYGRTSPMCIARWTARRSTSTGCCWTRGTQCRTSCDCIRLGTEAG